MSLISSIANIFNPPANPAPAPQPSPTAQGQQTQQPTQEQLAQMAAGQNPMQPNPAGATGQPGEGAALDQFKDLFTPPTAEQLATQGKFDPSTLFAGMDAAKVTEAVGKMQFAGQITEEQMQAIQNGGAGAIQTLHQLLNSTSQATMAQAMLANAEMIKQAMGQVGTTLDTRINAVSRQQQIRSAVHADNALLSNPAIQPMVDALTQSMALKNPQATPQQIKDSVATYITQMSAVFNPQGSAAGKGPELPAEFDFSDFLTR